MSFFPIFSLLTKNQPLDFQHQMLKYSQNQAQVDFVFLYYFYLLDKAFA